MASHKFLVSIGLPVFNGEKYLEESVDSILAQTFQDFELIISDNASTDRTEQICREYASKDSRVRYFRNNKNIGAPDNFNRAFELSTSKYFKWASCDDVYSPDYLMKCLDVLERNPSIILCHSKIRRIDENGKVIGNYDRSKVYLANSPKPHERFSVFISMINPVWDLFGLALRQTLEKTPLQRRFIGADRNLLVEISLIGRIYEVPEYLFFARDHPDSYTGQFYSNKKKTRKSRYAQLSWWNEGNLFVLPNLKNSFENFRAVMRVPISNSERILCFYEILKWFVKEGWLHIGKELKNLIYRAFIE
jgi:glycosyltransferase involved in cell wall biosynthesis